MNEYLVLLVDDEPDIRSELGGFLEAKGYDVVTARDGKEALALFNERKPVLVISDYKMPVMNGVELLRSIKKMNKDAHVIMMSGAADGKTIVEAMKENAFDFLIKPIDLKNLLFVVEAAIDKTKTRLAQARDGARRVGLAFGTELKQLDDDIMVLDYNGDLDEIMSPKFEAYIRKLAADNNLKRNLICFLTKVKYINNVGLNMLLSLNNFMKEKGFALFLCNISQAVDVYLGSLGYKDQFRIDRSVENIMKRIRGS